MKLSRKIIFVVVLILVVLGYFYYLGGLPILQNRLATPNQNSDYIPNLYTPPTQKPLIVGRVRSGSSNEPTVPVKTTTAIKTVATTKNSATTTPNIPVSTTTPPEDVLPPPPPPPSPVIVSGNRSLAGSIPWSRPFDWTIPPKLSLSPGSRWGLFRKSIDTVGITSTDSRCLSTIKVFDYSGKTIFDGSGTLPEFELGQYFVECDNDRATFAVIPADYHGASTLGSGGFVYATNFQSPRVSLIMPGWIRGSVSWPSIEPEQGVWNWSDADRLVANSPRMIWDTSTLRPSWVTDENFVEAYADYVKNLALHFPGLYGIELWNEPNPSNLPADWSTLVSYYTNLANTSVAAIRSVSSSVKIIGPTWYSPGFNDENRQLADNGTLALFDGFSYHDYMRGFLAPDSNAQYYVDSLHLARGIEQQMQSDRALIGNKPVFVDELGLYGNSSLGVQIPPGTSDLYKSDLSWSRGMNRAVKIPVIYIANNTSLLLAHVLEEYGTPQYSLPYIELRGWEYYGRGPQPKTSSFLLTNYWLNGATLVAKQTAGNKIVYAWKRPDNTTLIIAWTPENTTASFTLPAGVAATNVFGRSITAASLTEEPIFLFSASSDASSVFSQVLSALPSTGSYQKNLAAASLAIPGGFSAIIASAAELPFRLIVPLVLDLIILCGLLAWLLKRGKY